MLKAFIIIRSVKAFPDSKKPLTELRDFFNYISKHDVADLCELIRLHKKVYPHLACGEDKEELNDKKFPTITFRGDCDECRMIMTFEDVHQYDRFCKRVPKVAAAVAYTRGN